MMVDDFLRKAKDFIGGSKDEERERDYDTHRGRRVYPASEDRYDDEDDEEYSGSDRRSRKDRYDDEDDEDDEEYSKGSRRSRKDRYDDEDDDD
jgi:hypothetical protein